MYSIYHEDTRIPRRIIIGEASDSDGEGGDWRLVEQQETRQVDITTVWHKTVEHITLCGYDQVVAISEESINALFKSWWIRGKTLSNNCLHHWSHEGGLTIREFRQVRVQLLSANKAVVFFNIDSGFQIFAK